MTLISHSISLSEQLQNSYTQLWLSLKQEFENFSPNLPQTTEIERQLLDRLRSIKNSLVGTKARKIFTITDPLISAELVILARILEWDCLDLRIIYLKIEAAAIVGLLSIPKDQTVHVLLRVGFPAIIIDSITRFLQEIPIQSLLSSQALTRQAEHQLLQTLLRTLSSLYSIIQDVSSPRKWGFMTKSPERVHQPQSSRVKKFQLDYSSSTIKKNSFQDESSSMKVDRKGKTKASIDPSDNILIIKSSGIHNVDDETTVNLVQNFWPSSKPDKLKQACEHAKTLLSKYIAHGDALIPMIFALSPPSKCLPAEDSVNNFSLASIADLVVPCFQLIWLLCKDTSRQIWLVRKLMVAEDTYGREENCLKSLTNCLGIWSRSNHDLAIEYSIRTIGGLLSIHEPPNYSGDDELLDYLDLFVWSQASPSASYTNDGIGWTLACKTQEGSSPILRSALITSIVSLVEHTPSIRQEILQIQLNHIIELMDNASCPISVRCEAAYALAHALTISETLQYKAYEAKVIPGLKKLIDKAYEDPFPYSTPATVTQNAMLKESAFLALASLMSTLDAPRQEVVDLNLIRRFADSLLDDSILVRAASCQCCRALSRGASNFRNKLIDQDVGNYLFDLAFGSEKQDHQDPCTDQSLDQPPLGWIDDRVDNVDQDKDEVEIQLKVIAMGTISNLLIDFLPMKNEILARNGVEKLVQLLKFSNHQSSKETALWGLKSIIFSAPYQLKLHVVMKLGWEQIYRCLQDKNLSIQENMISFLRNLVCGETSDIEILFKQLITNNPDNYDSQLIDLLEDKLSLVASSEEVIHNMKKKIYPPESSVRIIENCSRENILVQMIFMFSNIATGTSTHKNFILHRPKIMKAILDSFSHPNLEFRRGSVWCIINLSHFDEDTKPNVIKNTIQIMEENGLVTKLKTFLEKTIHTNPSLDNHHHHHQYYNGGVGNLQLVIDDFSRVQINAKCALDQILKLKERFHC